LWGEHRHDDHARDRRDGICPNGQIKKIVGGNIVNRLGTQVRRVPRR
jgi:hypothetical protein